MSVVHDQTKGLQVLDRKVFAIGETIFREGDSGSRAYIIQRGKVDIVKDVDGEEVLVGSIGPGGIFGEMALIDNEPRMASAVAVECTVCIIVTSVMFQKKMNGLDPFLAGVLRILVENIRSIQNAKQDATALEEMFGDMPEDDGVDDALIDIMTQKNGGGADEDAFEIA